MPAAAIGAVASVGGALISSSASKSAANKASAAAKSELAFQQQQYDDWKETFGDVESNLSDYYSNLSPDYYEAAGLQAFEQERKAQMTQLRENLAQRGLATSGVTAAVERADAINAAEQRATIRAEAPSKVAQEQSNFLQIGMGLNPSASYAQSLAQQTQLQQQQSAAASQAAGQAWGSAISTTGKALSDYFGGSK